MENYNDENYLSHYGVRGMKWGVRRYQNKDGSLTAAGKRRNAKELSRYAKQEAYKTDRPSAVINSLKSTISDSFVVSSIGLGKLNFIYELKSLNATT